MIREMDKLKRFGSIFFFFVLMGYICPAFGQLSMGSWSAHLSYDSVNQVVQSTNKVFAVGSGALFSVTKQDQSVETYSKVTGLNDNKIAKIGYDSINNQLVIVYANSNIDFYTSSGVVNIPDLYDKQSTIDKTVNSIYFNGDSAYLSCNFGIVVVNDIKQEISDSYVIGSGGTNIPVLATVIFGGKIYGLTASGLMQADFKNHNLANYQVWSAVSSLPIGTNSNLVAFAGALWLLQSSGSVYKSTDGITWNPVGGLSNISRMQNDGTFLYFMSDANSITYYYNKNLATTSLSNTTPLTIVYDRSSKKFWLTNRGIGGLIQTDITGTILNKYKPSGPFDNSDWQMKFAGNKLFIVPGGAWAAQYNHYASVMMFQNNEWSYIDGATIAAATNMPSVVDFVSVAIDPADNTHFYAAAYGMGLYEFRNNAFYKWYNSQNSGIESIFPGQGIELYYDRIDGLAIDTAKNVWFTNGSVNNGIQYLTPSGVVKPFPFAALIHQTNIHSILIDNLNSNRKWGIISRYAPGIFVFDDNGTLDNTSDDKELFFSSLTDQDGNAFAPDFYYCLSQDLNNQIWAGTSEGPIIIQSPNDAFNSDFTITRIKIPRNDGTNYADYLLGTESANAIVVDGANRKWIGTQTSGLYLVSADGLQTLQHFTVDNSPLLSNTIMSLALNGTTGELFIGTDQGLISYQTDATNATPSYNKVYAYPNPVRETYHGQITITGLVANSVVKITDAAGNLVYQTVSNGGTATWNGNRAGGARVSTGVYLVLCVSPDGTQSTATKILVIN